MIVVGGGGLALVAARRAAGAAGSLVRPRGAVPIAYYSCCRHFDAVLEARRKSNAAGAQPSGAGRGGRWRSRCSRWPCPRRARLPPARALVAGAGGAHLAVRRAAVYLQPVGTFPYHSFQGLAIPLGVLAVQGVAVRVAAPAPVDRGRSRWPSWSARVRAQARGGEEQRAPGGRSVLHLPRRGARAATCGARPAPRWSARAHLRRLLHPVHDRAARPTSARCPGRRTSSSAATRRTRSSRARLNGAAARAFVLSTHARFLFSDCRKLKDLSAELQPLLGGGAPLRLRDGLRAEGTAGDDGCRGQARRVGGLTGVNRGWPERLGRRTCAALSPVFQGK